MVIKFSKDLLKGLQHLHKNNWIHRDLKPQNILVNEVVSQLALKYGEFGLKENEEIVNGNRD
jgi:serine/threonine protein kinase